MPNQTADNLERIQVDSLPPLPATAATLLAMAADPDVDIDALTRVIETDPPLSAKILGVANSAFYSPRRPVMTVKAAIVSVLGLNMVRNMAFGMALTGGLSTAACPRFDLAGYWVMALGTADLAGALARSCDTVGPPSPDAAYLTGLLHNLGELLMVHLWPHEMNEALARLESDPSGRLVEHERNLIGVDHWEAGARLARHWHLPAVVADSIEQFDTASESGQQGAMLPLLRAARQWLAGVAAGRLETLRVSGVDDTSCEYRSALFLERYSALTTLARSIA